MDIFDVLRQSDGVGRFVAFLLLAMSVASWVVILWKGWVIRRTLPGVTRSTQVFWQSTDWSQAVQAVTAVDREQMVLPLIEAAGQVNQGGFQGSLAASGDRGQQLTRLLRDALHAVLLRLQFGQVLLATVGSTAPFVGLLGTVWGIYHALTGISGSGQISIDQVAGPVGEALIMTAAGLAVAIPAVLAYNVYGRFIGRIEADLEGFARDLREWLAQQPSAANRSA